MVGSPSIPVSLKSFKRLVRVVNKKQHATPMQGSSEKRPGFDLADGQGTKKQSREACEL